MLPPGVPVSLFPFYWLVVMASITTQEILRFPPRLVPGTHLLENMRQVIHRIDFFGSLFNTVVVSVAGTVLVLFFDSLAAFAFAKYEFPARKPLFGILSATYMIPGRLSLVARFVTMADFGWAGSLKALVIPGAANAFGIFWMRQYAQNSLPDELLDADGSTGPVSSACTRRWPFRCSGRSSPSSASSRSSSSGTTYAVVKAGALMSVIPGRGPKM
ncbi:carbohydrate ABC transporter permease [Streptomyces sp. NPDC048504]|uniref:carbohydrate ABC transporter permease n=1 Tax=Streptomyces sp. NPDC048504 TaxID=3365559 RepID=UPI003720EF7F